MTSFTVVVQMVQVPVLTVIGNKGLITYTTLSVVVPSIVHKVLLTDDRSVVTLHMVPVVFITNGDVECFVTNVAFLETELEREYRVGFVAYDSRVIFGAFRL
uniref:Uncharacterized protein n=1 Tax=Cacopsylla melanoneura TaxID=428564 RepID=A0A8D9APH7_9HEMI